jgi:hypothetical protein
MQVEIKILNGECLGKEFPSEKTRMGTASVHHFFELESFSLEIMNNARIDRQLNL